MIPTERLFLTFLKFSLCLELPSDSAKYFGFAVDEFSKPVHATKCNACDRLGIICGYTRQSECTEFGRNFSFKRPGSIRSLFRIIKRFKRAI